MAYLSGLYHGSFFLGWQHDDADRRGPILKDGQLVSLVKLPSAQETKYLVLSSTFFSLHGLPGDVFRGPQFTSYFWK